VEAVLGLICSVSNLVSHLGGKHKSGHTWLTKRQKNIFFAVSALGTPTSVRTSWPLAWILSVTIALETVLQILSKVLKHEKRWKHVFYEPRLVEPHVWCPLLEY
jgi:hypothetical protein